MSLKHGILGLLNYGSMTGYELDKVFKDSLAFFWTAQTTQVYRELNQMEKSGWVDSETVIQTDRPNKKIYSITEIGHRELVRWLANPELEQEISTKSAFLMRVFFGGELSRTQNIETLQRYQSYVAEALKGMEQANHNIDSYQNEEGLQANKTIYWRATALFGQYYMEACLRWAGEVINLLKEANTVEDTRAERKP